MAVSLKPILLIGVLFSVAACASDPRLMNLRNEEAGPDEFAVLNTAPLEIPADLETLPTPTLAGNSRAVLDPNAMAIEALGGDPNGGAAADELVAYATRLGVETDIRTTLAEEDLAFRSTNRGRLLERLMSVNVYLQSYQSQSLDSQAELERLRAAGVRTPSAPPEGVAVP